MPCIEEFTFVSFGDGISDARDCLCLVGIFKTTGCLKDIRIWSLGASLRSLGTGWMNKSFGNASCSRVYLLLAVVEVQFVGCFSAQYLRVVGALGHGTE